MPGLAAFVERSSPLAQSPPVEGLAMWAAQVDKATKWGDLESEEEESEEEEEEEEPEEDTESLADGLASVTSGYNSSLPSGIETPEVIDLRKGKAGARLDATLSQTTIIWICIASPLAAAAASNSGSLDQLVGPDSATAQHTSPSKEHGPVKVSC